MKKKKITMQEIADMLGISKVTVSKALNGKDGVGAELKQKILKIAEESGYQLPSKPRAGDSIGKKIVVFCDDKYFDEADKSYFYVRIYKQIAVELAKRGCIASLLTLKKEEGYESASLFLKNQELDGIILLGKLEEAFHEIVRSTAIPRIYVDSDRERRDGDEVLIENFYSTYALTRHLLENGHREIGFVGTICATQSIRDRYLGFCRAMMEYRLPIRREWVVEDRTEENEWIEMRLPEQLPTAFVCNCDSSAYYLEQQLTGMGMHIPEHISIVGFDDDSFAELCVTPLTTVAINVADMAWKTANTLLERIADPDAEQNRVLMVDTSIICRESVRKL